MIERFVFYQHDGQGGVLLQGSAGRARMTVDQAKARFEPIEAWRQRMERFGDQEVALVDHCMTTLLIAIDQAESFAGLRR